MKRVMWGSMVTGFVLTVTLGAQAPAPGQGRAAGPPPAPPANLQVLPKDFTRQQVVQVMAQFNQALGVQCGYCHQFTAPGDPTNDMASDAKPQKNAARAMMRMVQAINPQVQAAVNKTADNATRVGCIMCHRGEATPKVPPPAPPPGAPGAAPPAGGAAPPAAPGAAR